MIAEHRPSGRHVRNCVMGFKTLHAGVVVCESHRSCRLLKQRQAFALKLLK